MDTFDEIHLAVKNNNISYAEIAENIGISREHLSRQLSKKELSKKNTNKILDYLKSQKIDISTEIDNHTPTSTIKTNLGVQVYDVDFSAGKINIENLAVYENAMIENVPKSDAAILVFTSPMNVRAYFSTHQIDATQKVISIGKTTSEVLSEFAVQHQVAYAPYNYCLVDEIMSL